MRLNPVNSGKRNYLYNNLMRTCKNSMLSLNEIVFVVDLVKKKMMEEKKKMMEENEMSSSVVGRNRR